MQREYVALMAWELFWIFFKVGLFCFGGGNAMLGVFERLLVSEKHFLTSQQFSDIVAISQITPGPVATNLATYTGAVLGSAPAESVFYSFMATLGVTLPAIILVLIIARFFRQFGNSKEVKWVMGGIKPAVIGLIMGSAIILCRFSIYDAELISAGYYFEAINFWAVAIAAISLVLTVKAKLNPIVILIGSGIFGIFVL